MKYIITIVLINVIQILSANTLYNSIQDSLPTILTPNNNLSIGESRGIAVGRILGNTLSPYSNCIDESYSIYYSSRDIYENAIKDIALLKTQLLKYSNLDYIPNNIHHPNNLLEHLVTIYSYDAKTKKRFIIGQLSFEFEDKSRTISKLKFINRSEIHDLKALQLKIDTK